MVFVSCLFGIMKSVNVLVKLLKKLDSVRQCDNPV